MATKIPATIITGFLGAGKTTLIQNLLQNAEGLRIALIINEFGDLGVDGGILTGCGIEGCAEEDIVELSNGCICCTVAEDFIPTLQGLLDRDLPPEHIVIETSGLALPQPLVRAFNWPAIETRVTVDAVVTVVDGRAVCDGQFAHDVAAVDAQRASDESLDHETPLAELFDDQIACADMIIINKSDLLGQAEADGLHARLRASARPAVQVIGATKGQVPIEVLLGQKSGAESDIAARSERHHHHHDGEEADHEHEHHHDHDAFHSFTVLADPARDIAQLQAGLGRIISDHHILRLKGFARVSGKPMRLTIQAVGPRVDAYFDEMASEDLQGTRLVVIGEARMDEKAITAAIQALTAAEPDHNGSDAP